jgi:hypothetical protein
MKKDNRGFIQISFAWLFAIVVGALILFFAIYASVKLIKTESTVSTAETGKEIAVLLNPLETGFGEEKTTPLKIATESRIGNNCQISGVFGEQEIIVTQKSGGEWKRFGAGSVFYNKYIFSNKSVQGKDFYLFSKPFEFPFKVADLIFLTSAEDNYCFLNPPENIKEELKNLNQPNLLLENCPSESFKVCFSGERDCDILVNKNQRTVSKNGSSVYFETDSLMLGAIFSDPKIYECQTQRLMKRLGELSLIYNDKQGVVSGKGCFTEVNLLPLVTATSSYRDSSELAALSNIADDVEKENKQAYCELW